MNKENYFWFTAVLSIAIIISVSYFVFLQPKEQVEYTVSDDLNIDSEIIDSYMMTNDLIIKYNNPNDEIVRIEGLPKDRYKIEEDLVIIYNFDKENDHFEVHIGDYSDVYVFGGGVLLSEEKEYKVSDVKIGDYKAKKIMFPKLKGKISLKDKAEKDGKLAKDYFKLEKTKYFGDAKVSLKAYQNITREREKSSYDCNCKNETYNFTDNQTNKTIEKIRENCETCRIYENYTVSELIEINPETFKIDKNTEIYEVRKGAIKIVDLPNEEYGYAVYTNVSILGVEIKGATWWNSSWTYKQEINLSNTAGVLTDYQVKITLNTTNFNYSHANATGKDIRFTNSSNDVLDYWINETWNITGESIILVEVNSLANATNTSIYLYYGNSGASSESNYSETMTKDSNITSLVSEWSFEIGSGTTVADYIGGNNGSFVNSPEWQGSDGGWWAGENYTFDTGDHLHFTRSQIDYINVPDDNSLDFGTGDFSVSFWVKFDDLTSSNLHRILGKDSYAGGTYTGWFFQWAKTTSKLQFATRDSPSGLGTYHSSTNTFTNTSHWYHVISVRDSNTIYLYVDNISEGSSAESSATNIDNSVGLRFGCIDQSPGSTFNLNGYLDEIKIYNKALNSRERESLFQRRKYASTEPTYTIGAEETSGDITNPTSNSPSDASYSQNSAQTIGWILQDETGVGNYTILRNGSTQNSSTSWTNNTNLGVWVNTSTVGNNWNYTIKFNDSSGNEGTQDTVFINITEITAPNITISSPTATTYTTITIDLNISADETVDIWWYNLNSGSNETFTPNTTITGVSGSNNLIVYANNTVGNTSNSSVNFTVDLPPNNPEPSITPATVYTNTSANCSATFSDNDSATGNLTFKWYVDSVSVFNETKTGVANGSSDWSLLSSGNFSKGEVVNCTVISSDGVSNTTNSTAKTVQNSPPYVVLNYPSDGAIEICQNPTLNVTYYDVDGDNGNVSFYSGYCACEGTGYEIHNVSGHIIYIDCNADKCWTPTAGSSYTWGLFINEGDNTCIGKGGSYPACNYCDNLNYGGFTDWVLPTYTTLYNLCGSVSCSGTCFDGDGSTGDYWANNEFNTIYATSVNFNPCYEGYKIKDYNMNVRCVQEFNVESLGNSTNITNSSTATYQWENLTANTTYDWFVIATDGLDNTTSDPWDFTTDSSPPNTTSTAVDENNNSYTFGEWTNSNYVNVSLNCSDNCECNVTQYCLDTGNSCTPNLTYSAPVYINTTGTSYIRFRSNDTIGNLETTKSETIKIDLINPTIAINNPENITYYSTSIPVNVTVSDNIEFECNITDDGSLIHTSTENETWTTTLTKSGGSHNVSVFCMDAAGNNATNTTYYSVWMGLNISVYYSDNGDNATNWNVSITNGTNTTTGTYNNSAMFEWDEIPYGEINLTFDDGSPTLYYFQNTTQTTNNETNYQELNITLIAKASNPLSLTSSEGWNIYETDITILQCTAPEGTLILKYDSGIVPNPYIIKPTIGTHEVYCEVSETENYKPTNTSNSLVVNKLVSCISSEIYAFNATISTSTNITTLNFGSFVNIGYVKSDVSDVRVITNVSNVWKNTTNGSYLVVDNTNLSSFVVEFGDYIINNSYDSHATENIIEISDYTQQNPYVFYSILDEITREEMFPPNATLSTYIFCDSGEDYIKIQDNNTRFLIGVKDYITQVNLKVWYSANAYYSRNLLPSEADALTLNFYVVDAYEHALDRIDFYMVDINYYDSKLQVYKNIQNQSIIITEGNFDVSHFFSAYLIEDKEYLIRCVDSGGTTEFGRIYVVEPTQKTLGKQTVNLNPQAVIIADHVFGNAYTDDLYESLYVDYLDDLNQTNQVNVVILFENGTVFANESYAASSLSLSYNISNFTNQSYWVKYSVDQESFGNLTFGMEVSPDGALDAGLPGWLALMVSMTILVFIGGLATRSSIMVSTILLISWLIMFIIIGWFPSSSVFVGLLVILGILGIIIHNRQGGE